MKIACTYPECKCPFDMGSDGKCLLGKQKDLYATNNNDYVDVKTEGGTTRLVLLANM